LKHHICIRKKNKERKKEEGLLGATTGLNWAVTGLTPHVRVYRDGGSM